MSSLDSSVIETIDTLVEHLRFRRHRSIDSLVAFLSFNFSITFKYIPPKIELNTITVYCKWCNQPYSFSNINIITSFRDYACVCCTPAPHASVILKKLLHGSVDQLERFGSAVVDNQNQTDPYDLLKIIIEKIIKE